MGMRCEWTRIGEGEGKPSSRSSHSVNINNNNVYLFGGESAPRTPIDSKIHVYDLKSDTWTTPVTLNEPPSARLAHGAAFANGKLYVFGGQTSVAASVDIEDKDKREEATLNDLFVFDPETSTWTELTSQTHGPTPERRSYHTMTSYSNKIYLFGGVGVNGRLNDLHEFDPATLTWRQLASPDSDKCPGRGGSAVVAYKGKLYVVNGFAGHERNDVHEYDIGSNTWRQTEWTGDNPPRSVSAVVVAGGGIITMGGEADPSKLGHAGAGKFTDAVFHFSPRTNHWTRLLCEGVGNGKMPMPRGWHTGAALSDGSGLVIFGGVDTDNARLDDFWKLTLVISASEPVESGGQVRRNYD